MAANDSARAIIRNALNEYGLGGLATWVWEQYLQSGATDVGSAMAMIQPELRKRPEYQARFPGMAALEAKGHAISEDDYIAYERAVTGVMRAAGLPPGFYDQPSDFAAFIANEISPQEVQERVQNAQVALYSASPAVRQQLDELYGTGLTPGDVTAFFLDPDVAQPILTRRLAAARISGTGIDTGFGKLGATGAERIADRALTDQQVEQGFGTLVRTRELFTEQIGAREIGGRGIDEEDQLGAAFLGDADTQERIERERKKRAGAFEGGGGFATSKEGFAGLGSAAS